MEYVTPEEVDVAEAHIRADHRDGKITKEQFQKEMLIMARARQQALAASPSPETNVVGWIYEDELPKGYPYDAMFPHSKVDGVRMFPVFAPAVQEQFRSDDLDDRHTLALVREHLSDKVYHLVTYEKSPP